jgi:CubicO group peptidase (beta-lactamase class C family)
MPNVDPMKHHSSVNGRRRRVVLAFVLFVLPLQAAESKADRIDRLMQAYVDARGFQGAVLVADRGEVIFEKGYGLANVELNVPNTPDTKFRVGSLTKQFTAMLVLQLAAEGKLKLDARLSEYVPEYPAASGDRITIHHLLTHQSGIPNYTTPDFIAKRSREFFRPVDLAKVFWDKPLNFEPGTQWRYSNSGYHVLGLVIERVTGKSYEQALGERILEPLGMRDTGYDHTEAVLPRRAAGYTKTPDGLENAAFGDMSIPYSAGGMYSTVQDLRKWDRALYTEKLLSRKYLDLMFEPAAKLGEDRAYGYGWMLSVWTLPGSKRQLRAIEHFGGINGFSSMIARLPEDRGLIVALANILGVDWGGATRSIAQILCGELPEMPKKSLAGILGQRIRERGVTAAIEEFGDNRDQYEVNQGELNSLGYHYLRAGRLKEAVEVFRLNVKAFPQSWRVYDSLGEALAAAGNREFALENYRRALELNPGAESARKAISELERQ